jgi:hypothetical protein
MADSSSSKPSVDQEYSFINRRLSETWSPIHAGLKWFAQIFSAILAGTFWLAKHITSNFDLAARMTDWLVFGITTICVLIVIDNSGTWWLWRKHLAEISQYASIPMPVKKPWWTNFWMEYITCAIMLIACWLFYKFNPITYFR